MLLLFAKFLEQGLNVLEDDWSKLHIVYGAQAGQLGGQACLAPPAPAGLVIPHMWHRSLLLRD